MPGYTDVKSGGQHDRMATVHGFHAGFLDMVAMGKVPGFSILRKFGSATAIGQTLTVIATAQTYRTPTAITSLWIVSNAAADTAGGTGLNTVEVIGIGSGWVEVSSVYTMAGTTAVPIGGFYRTYRMKGKSSGTYAGPDSPSHNSTITIQDSSGGGNVWAQIVADGTFGLGQTQIGAFTVPKGKRGYLIADHFSGEVSKDLTLYRFVRDNADSVSTPYLGVMRIQDAIRGVIEQGDHYDGVWTDGYIGPCDIGYMAKVATGDVDIEIDFTMLLEDI